MTQPALEDVDFFTDLSIIDDPYVYFDALREKRGPVYLDDTRKMAVVTGHAEAMEVYRDSRTFSSCNAATGPFAGPPIEVEGDDASAEVDAARATMPMAEYMVSMDSPEHEEHRGLLAGLFTPRRLKENEDFMWGLADQQLEKFLPSGKCEFISDYASPFAGMVIADLLGVPDEDRARFQAGFEISAKTSFQVGENPEDSVKENPLGSIDAEFHAYIDERRAHPKPDILGHLASVTFSDGTQPDVPTLARESGFLFAAGQETTVRMMAFAIRHLAENPDVQDRLRANRQLIPHYVEEVLRAESPIKSHFRLARRATTVGGVRIPAGTTVMLLIGAANHDPREYACPHAVDLDRENVRTQVAFSRGAHSCLGQPLARSEGRITIERVLDRMRNLRVSEEHHGPADARRWDWLPTFIFRGLERVHVEFDPA